MAEIKCIFFSEFHHIAGPRVSYQAPQHFDLKCIFDEVHDLIITKPQLYDRLISIDVGDYRVVGCPKCIDDDKKYERNAFIFNMVFVFDSTTCTSPYEPVILKMGDAFKTYELESSFLSCDATRPQLMEILANVHDKLNSCGFCTIRIDDTNHLHLKITPSLEEPPEVEDWHVPIFTCTKEDISATSWDLTIEQILPYIDGFNHVKKISHFSEVDIAIVRICIQHLVLYGFLSIISIFQYSNVYVTLPKLQELLTDQSLQRECLEYVALPGKCPAIGDVFRLYCRLEAGLAVRDLTVMHDLNVIGVDERMLVQFGLMRSMIRHLQKYPVQEQCDEEEEEEEEFSSNELKQIAPYLDGSHCFDKICCILGISSQELDNRIESSPNILVCWK